MPDWEADAVDLGSQRAGDAPITAGPDSSAAALYTFQAATFDPDPAPPSASLRADLQDSNEAESERALVGSIDEAARDPKQWRAAAWRLERLAPHRYARLRPESISVEQMKEIAQELAGVLSAEIELPELRQQLQARLAAYIETITPSTPPRKRRAPPSRER